MLENGRKALCLLMVVPPGEYERGCRRERKLNWTTNEVAISCRTGFHTRVKWNEDNQLYARRTK